MVLVKQLGWKSKSEKSKHEAAVIERRGRARKIKKKVRDKLAMAYRLSLHAFGFGYKLCQENIDNVGKSGIGSIRY